MLPSEKYESQKDKEKCGGMHLCTAGHEVTLLGFGFDSESWRIT